MRASLILGRFGVLAASVMVTMIVAEVTSKAATSLATANVAVVNYNLGAGGTTPGITPPAGTAVLLMGTNTTSTNFSVGSVNLVHIAGTQIRWVGLESPPSASIVRGGSTTPGTHVVYLDYNHQVDVEILSADQFAIHNKATTTQAGSVKEIW